MEDPSAVIEAHQKRVEELNSERFELPPDATSLTFLQKVYRSSSVAITTRMRAAIAAIQFEHPKLAVTATINSGDFADQLDKAVERSRKVAVIEAKPTEANVSSEANASSNTKRPSNGVKPMIPDRRFRR